MSVSSWSDSYTWILLYFLIVYTKGNDLSLNLLDYNGAVLVLHYIFVNWNIQFVNMVRFHNICKSLSRYFAYGIINMCVCICIYLKLQSMNCVQSCVENVIHLWNCFSFYDYIPCYHKMFKRNFVRWKMLLFYAHFWSPGNLS